ncbi:T9SS type A sorting domain-containing protein [Aquimarina litoralis]|uniref:T9SS type A sorting domain-containing protein n=1 Tax=Aquimarina litoralis TaxID=584605 RepID=UPI001C58C998|nr:T9SS type A sorting domain-containing protein [Aquimarina litoralis]MBW1295782.1 T9SS type A sorting domain-containing protein [Aquimarina litoralis]
MKNSLLICMMLTFTLGFSQIPSGSGIYINKLILSPNGPDLTNEYIELRGTPNAVIPTDLYLINVEGDGEASRDDYGEVGEVIQLGDGTRTFGSNGFLSIVANYTDENTSVVTTNPYSSVIAAGTTIVTIELVGNDVTGSSSSNVSSFAPDIGYDGNFEDWSATYMLIQAPSDPSGIDIDANNDGIIDATGDHTMWTRYDSVSFLDEDDLIDSGDNGEFGYGQIIVVRDLAENSASIFTDTGATVLENTGSNVHFWGRQGSSTGFAASDWIAASFDGTGPNWEFSGNTARVSPAEFAGYIIPSEIYGALNPTAATLSVTEQELTNDISFYPNPTNNIININSKNDIVQSLEVIDVTGKILLDKKENLDVVDLTQFTTGLYYLNIYGDGAKITKAIVKK